MAAIGSQEVATRVRFASFELDLRSGELSADGRRIRLQDQPFRLLKLLLEHAGEVVTREELQRQLWAAETFVDFDHGLNKAVAKLRDTLDRGSDTSLIETLPRRGYRFTAAVEWFPTQTASNASSEPVADPFPTARRSRRTMLLALAGTCTLIVAAVVLLRYEFSRSSQQPTIRSIAVLPLVNLSGDHSQDYFADGMTDELITMLAKNTSLRVVSRTSVMRYKGVSRPMHEIARELGTDGILEGSISRSANRVHLTVQLVQGQDDAHIWAESYDRDLSDAVSLLSELSSTIAKEVKLATSAQVQPQKKVNPEAYNLYLRARILWFAGDYGRAQDIFQKVIQLQPDYAAAWSGLSDCYAALTVDGTIATPELRQRAEFAARRALELDDASPEAHHSMAAVYYFLDWNWTAAEAEMQRAIQLNPNSSEAHHLHSYILATLNRPEEALQEQKTASKLDPELRPWALGREYIRFRRYDEAIAELTAQVKDRPHENIAHWLLATAYHCKGMEKESVQQYVEVYRGDNDEDAASGVQREFQRGGAQAVAQFRLKRWLKIAGRSTYDPYQLALMYGRVGDKERTLQVLEKCFELHSGSLVWMQREPDFDFVHSEPRYRAIVQKMGLPGGVLNAASD